jgi:hypothetical protein
MKRLDFIKSLGALVGAAFIPKVEPTNVELMRITSSGNVGMGILNPKQILEVTRRVNGGMSPLYKRIK